MLNKISKIAKIISLNKNNFNNNFARFFSSKNKLSQTNLNVIYDKENKKFSEIKLNLQFSIDLPEVSNYEWDKIHKNIYDLFEYSMKEKHDSKAQELLENKILIFLEKNIKEFSAIQNMKMFNILAENNRGTLAKFLEFQYVIGKDLGMSSSKLKLTDEEPDTRELFRTLSLAAENGYITQEFLNYVLVYFANKSNLIILQNENSPRDISGNSLYDLIWLSSISLASILQRREEYIQNNIKSPFVETQIPPLNQNGANALAKILKIAERTISKDSNFSQNTVSKVRLYKSLYYLQLEGVELSSQLIEFMNKFKSFYMLNMDSRVTNSNLEEAFELVLRKHNIPFEKEKKLDFCLVDYFTQPDFCFEVNGPSHYFLKQTLKGKHVLKKRVLKKQKYQFFEITQEDLINNTWDKFIPLRFNHLKDDGLQNMRNQIKEEIKNLL